MDDTPHLLPAFKPTSIRHWLRGVFEGGGVKGVAYKGALEAVEKNDCWFEAVAGASAGAITAALIAAGYSSKDMDEPMAELLAILEPKGFWRAARNLRRSGQIYSRQEFTNILDRYLRKKLPQLDTLPVDKRVTFEQLYAATEMELYVVAADITRQEPLVFSREFTPICQVADAVAASSSIPFFFDGGTLTSKSMLETDAGPKGRPSKLRGFRTVVDGGVWTNFPMFVFEDQTFDTYMRKALELQPRDDTKPNGPIVGFMLYELKEDKNAAGDAAQRRWATAKAYEEIYFIDEFDTDETLVPQERARESGEKPLSPTSYKAWVVNKVLAFLIFMVGFYSRKNRGHGPDTRRSKAPKSALLRQSFLLVDETLGFAHLSFVSIIASFLFILLEALLLYALAQWMGGEIREGWLSGGWDFYGPIVGATAMAVAYVAQLTTLSMIFLGALMLNWTLLLPMRRILVGLMKTLVATPGTSPWEHQRKNVIPLPIPPDWGPLSDLSKLNPGDVIENARLATEKELPDILKRAKAQTS